jgi:hypothetical protein
VRFLLLLAAAASLSAQTDPWKPLQFLSGEWSGEGDGKGDCSFAFDLQHKIIVRKSFAEYPSAPRHDDLMVIYLEGDKLKADYFDNEGHVIHYAIETKDDAALFTSDAGYILAYHKTAADKMTIDFDVAKKRYLHGELTRKSK